MSAVSMIRYTLVAYLLLCILKIDRKQNSGGKVLVHHCMSPAPNKIKFAANWIQFAPNETHVATKWNSICTKLNPICTKWNSRQINLVYRMKLNYHQKSKIKNNGKNSMSAVSMIRYTLVAYLLLCILKIDGKQNSGGIELVHHCMSPGAAPWFLPLLKFHYNNYSITKSKKGFHNNIIVND